MSLKRMALSLSLLVLPLSFLLLSAATVTPNMVAGIGAGVHAGDGGAPAQQGTASRHRSRKTLGHRAAAVSTLGAHMSYSTAPLIRNRDVLDCDTLLVSFLRKRVPYTNFSISSSCRFSCFPVIYKLSTFNSVQHSNI